MIELDVGRLNKVKVELKRREMLKTNDKVIYNGKLYYYKEHMATGFSVKISDSIKFFGNEWVVNERDIQKYDEALANSVNDILNF